MADRARVNAIVNPAIPDEKHARRVPFKILQLIHCPPDREDGAIALHDEFTVERQFDAQNDKRGDPK
ncbi:MAG: hypothetical protein WBZ31_07390 [Thiobacillus sp.]